MGRGMVWLTLTRAEVNAAFQSGGAPADREMNPSGMSPFQDERGVPQIQATANPFAAPPELR